MIQRISFNSNYLNRRCSEACRNVWSVSRKGGGEESKEADLTEEKEEEEEEDQDRKVSPADPAAGQKKAVCLWQKEGGWAVGLKFPLLAILCHGTRCTKSYRGSSYDDRTNHSFVGSGFLGKLGRCVIKWGGPRWKVAVQGEEAHHALKVTSFLQEVGEVQVHLVYRWAPGSTRWRWQHCVRWKGPLCWPRSTHAHWCSWAWDTVKEVILFPGAIPQLHGNALGMVDHKEVYFRR